VVDFTFFFTKIIKARFCERQSQIKKDLITRLPKSTIEFFNNFEKRCYDLCKLALADGFTSRYYTPYVAGALLTKALDLELSKMDKILKQSKIDLEHVVVIHDLFEEVLRQYFGPTLYRHFQEMGLILFKRYQCLFY